MVAFIPGLTPLAMAAAVAAAVLPFFALTDAAAVKRATSSNNDTAWYTAEISLLADLKSRVTGSPSHNRLIDHIQAELELLGFTVYNDTLTFTYLDQPQSPPSLTVGNQSVEISSYLPYSGTTDNAGISGKLIDLTGPGDMEPNWASAKGGIAVLNITNTPWNISATLALWPEQPPWYVESGMPDLTAEAKVANLTQAALAGVNGVVYVWQDISVGNARGQYVPFKRLFQGVPAVYVAGDAAESVTKATNAKQNAHLTLAGDLVPETPTRTVWIVVEGTKYPNESVIINTHTDGVNAVEENGHIALLAKAKDLASNPPERTTVLLFVTGHMRQPAFSKGKATTRWLQDNPHYWKGGAGQMKAVASVCVEHLGAVDFVEDLSTGRYWTTGNQTDELLYANTPEMVNVTEKFWDGAYPGKIRVNNPIPKGVQSGEGEPLTIVKVPNLSLITTPLYLLAEMPDDFDERTLINVSAMGRQIDSFMKIWDALDTMPTKSFGIVPPLATTAAD